MILLVDTCVVLDYILKREPFYKWSKLLINEIQKDKYIGILTSKTILDIWYIVKHYTNDETKTRLIIKDILTIFKVVDTRAIEIMMALDSDINDYEDAVINESAISQLADYIITRNIKDYKNSTIKVLSPKELLDNK